MNGIVNKVLLLRDKFMLEMHLKQPRFTYSACRPFVHYSFTSFIYISNVEINHKNES